MLIVLEKDQTPSHCPTLSSSAYKALCPAVGWREPPLLLLPRIDSISKSLINCILAVCGLSASFFNLIASSAFDGLFSYTRQDFFWNRGTNRNLQALLHSPLSPHSCCFPPHGSPYSHSKLQLTSQVTSWSLFFFCTGDCTQGPCTELHPQTFNFFILKRVLTN